MKIFALMLAGALGTLARYGFSIWIQDWVEGWGDKTFLGAAFPLSTLLINVLGSLLLAVIVTLALAHAVKPEWRLVLGTGFMGAFTTFSTFELESEHLLSTHGWKAASVYIAGNLLLGFGAILLGRMVAVKVLGAYT
jgi:CrcB protein